MSDYIPQNIAEWNYLSLPEICASVSKALKYVLFGYIISLWWIHVCVSNHLPGYSPYTGAQWSNLERYVWKILHTNIRPKQLTKHICAVSIVGHFTQQPFLGIPVPCPAVKSKEPIGRSGMDSTCTHDDVIKWKHFPRNWPFVRGIHRSAGNFTHKGQWRRALMFSLICVWVKGWINNRESGDLRRYRTHYDVTVMPVFQLLAMTWLIPWALEW